MSATARNPENNGGWLRVLIVEDDPDSVLPLTRVLKQSGCVVQTTRNGTEALTVAEAFAPHAVLIDIGLPGLDGLHVARELRKRDRNAFLVAITGRSEPEDILSSKAAGFDHHFVKPFDCAALVSLLANRRRMIHESEVVTPPSDSNP
jgi:DNA-binding response OmpR family regulator